MVQVVLTTEDHQEMETLTVCVRVCVCPSPAGEKQAAHQTVSDPAPLPPTVCGCVIQFVRHSCLFGDGCWECVSLTLISRSA